ncbi:MAG: hypothetical protein WB762_13630 [Candidatus Sulfotelmatobacter sp.]
MIARVLRILLEGIAALDGKITEAADARPRFFHFRIASGNRSSVGATLVGGTGYNAIVMPGRKRYRTTAGSPQ